MISRSDAYGEIIKTIAKIVSGVAISLASFVTIVSVIALSIPEEAVIVGGYEVVVSAKLLVSSASILLFLLLLICLILSLLLFLDDEHADSVS